VTDKGSEMQKDEWLSTKHFGLRWTQSHFSCLGETAATLLSHSLSLSLFTPIWLCGTWVPSHCIN